MIKQCNYSICQLLIIICMFKRRKTEVFLILHHCAINSVIVTLSHTSMSREVMITWRYSGNPSKSPSKTATVSEFRDFSLDFTRGFCLPSRSFPPKRSTMRDSFSDFCNSFGRTNLSFYGYR